MSKIFKNRKLILISLFSLIILIVSTISFIALINSNNNTKDPKFVYNSGHYITDQEAISTSSLSSNYTKMNTLYTANGLVITASGASIDSNKTIAIESELDFFAFTMLAKANDSYLTYKYELLCNLDMSTITDPVYPIGYNGKEFSGTFNGNGHIIKNLYLIPVSTSNASTFNSTNYYALFRKNTGTIANFGLVNPKINVAITPAGSETANGIYYVSNVVGWNAGTVSYVFVRDNIGTEAKRTPGIEVLESGFHIAGLVGKNTGTFNNSYYASSTLISSTSGRPAEMQEILVNGTATDNTLFFYNSLIDTYTSTAVRYGGFIDRTYNYTTHYGTYEATLSTLNAAVVSTTATGSHDNTWYMGDTYENIGDLSTFFDTVITPVTRGFKTNQVRYDVNDDKKYHVEINNANDLSYIYELMDTNSKFASNAFVYELDPKGDDNITRVAGINLDNVLSPKYQNGIAAEFRTKDEYITAKSTYATLYLNAFSYKVTTLGIDAYGVFPYLTGTVRYLNFVVGGSTQLEFTNSSTNITAYGAIAGYAEGATIDHCNVYNNFKITNKVGKYFVGGAVGILAGEGEIKNSTANGTIASLNSNPKSFTNPEDYPDGVIIGGVVGYIDSSLGSVDTLYNETTITAQGYTGQEFVAGGVIGAGYTSNADELQNNGSITISNSNYSKLYVSGVIGRLLGVSSQITLFTNNGDINVTQIDAPTYVSGVLNADIQTDDTIAASLFKQKSNFYFYAAALTNGANVTLTGTKTDTYMYTDVINVLNNNGFITKLSGIYNLNYKFASETTSLNAQSISVNLVDKFAPVVMSNADSEHSASTIDLTTSYNLRDITLTQSAAISYSINYAGCAYGSYITYADVRNEGNIKFEPASAITGNITISGVFNELSSNSTASSIYNGGDIEINFKANITGNINVAGICYANRNGITDIDSYNPTSTNYDSELLGSLNDTINNGNIKVSSSSFSSIEYGNYWYRASNGRSVAANILYTTYSGCKVAGNINTAGIVNINESVITNTFNLGNVKALNYVTETTEANKRQINAGGISTLNIGKYAYIINSANNGDITAANLASYTYSDTSDTAVDSFDGSKSGMISSKTIYYSDVTVGGIVSRNDKAENGNNYVSSTTNSNSSQVISFTINYGSIYAYNYAETNYIANSNPSCKAAAIIGAGLCNAINVNNYGTVYSGEVSAGIFGLVSLARYAAEIAINKVYIANVLNYGNIYSLKHAYDAFDFSIPSGLKVTPDHTNLSLDLEYPEYTDFINDNLNTFKFITDNSNTLFSYFSGSVIGIIDFNNDENATQIIIRYLVSFNDLLSISGAEININNAVTADTSTIYSPYLKPDVVGKKDRDDYLATNVQYAPLSSSSFTADFLKTNSTSGSDISTEMTFYGVFNENFTFREVIDGKYEDGSTYFNTNLYKTDRFLTDFFQFVPYSYVNENLMEKIGWRTSAYLDAANKFANSLEGTYLFYKSDLGTSTYSDDLTAALSTSTWSQNADPKILTQLVEKLIGSSDKAGILAYIEYIFSDTNSNSSILNTLRSTIVKYVYDNYKTLIDTSELLKFANGYSTILANALCSNADNEVKQDVITYISEYISNLDGVTKEELLLSYIDYLDQYGSSFFNATSTQSKYELLQNLFSEITDPTFYKTLIDLFGSDNQNTINDFADYSLSGYGGFIALSDEAKLSFFDNVIANNSAANIKEYLDDFANEIGLFDYLRAEKTDNYDAQSFTDINNKITDTTNINLIDERVKLWNKIKDTTTFTTWFNTKVTDKKYYLATEYNNTYQTDSAPIPYGIEGQAAVNMVRSNTPNVLGESSDLDFIYTTNVTSNTYFYGPYAYPTTGYTYIEATTIDINYSGGYGYNSSYIYYSIDGGKNYTNTGSTSSASIPAGATCYSYSRWSGYQAINVTLNGTFYIKNGNTYTKATGNYNPNTLYYKYLYVDRNTLIPNGDGTTLSTTEQGTVNKNSTNISSNWTINSRTGWYSVLFTEGSVNLTSVTTGKTSGLTRNDSPLVIRKRTSIGCYDNSSANGITADVALEYKTKKTSDYILINNSVRQSLDSIFISREVYNKNNYVIGTQAVNCASGDKYTVYHNGQAITEATDLTTWNYILDNYVYTATVNTANSNWYSSDVADGTGRTGLYVKFIQRNAQRQIDYDELCMFTTRYIDYSATQLLKLDGVLTKCTDEVKPESTDEKNIINDIFNTILLTDETEFMQIVAKSLFETLGSTNSTNATNSTDHINFINNFIGVGATTTKKVNNTTAPLVYLMHTTTPSQTIAQYLATLSLDNEYKKKLLNAASKDKDVFVELIELLFNKSLTVGADTTYDPGHSLNYGGNFDVDLLNSRLKLIAYNKYSTTPSSSLPNVIPGKNLTDDSSTGITYSGSETQSQYTVLATGEKIPLTVDPNSITSANYSGANAAETVSSQNIGYYLGNQNKINQKTITFGNALIAPTDTINGDYTDSSGKTPSESKKTPRQLFIVTGANGNYQGNTIRPLTDTEFSALPEGIQNLVPSTNTAVTHSMIRLSQRYPGSINFTNTTQNDAWAYHGAISYFGKTYGSTGNGIALPNNGIWFKPQKTGKIRMVFYTGSDGKSFCLTKVNRTSATTANPFAGTAFTASAVDLTGRNNLPKYLLLYYEYEVTDEDLSNNVEFWLLGGDDSEKNGAYFLYLDMGINGGGPKTEDITYYEQNTLNNTTNYNDNVYKLISYLTPLNAGNNVISYIPATDVTSSNVTDYYTYSTATTYNEGTTYYSRDGSGHYVIAHGVTSENVTNYYLFSQATTYDSETTYYVQHKILEYQNQVFCDRFMKILASSSNAATYALIKSLDDKDAYKGMLKYLATLDSRNFDSIIAYANANHLFPAEFEYYLTGGWLATDYYRKYKTDFSTTYLHDRLTAAYQYLSHKTYLNPDDIDTFIEFCKHIDYPLDMNYGIYALASNEGIKNGVFIPDNLNLDKMDPEYTTDTDVNFKLIETNTTLESNSTDAKWRGGTGTDEGEDDVSGYTGNNVTVNQAFYIEMKQLKKSISTTVFELTLKKGDNLYYGDVDLDNHTVTYYLTELSTGNYTVDTIDLAYGATAYENAVITTTGSTEFKKNSIVDVTDAGEVMQFTVFAEDTDVYKTYKIIFKVLVTDLTMEYDTEKTKTETTTASASSFTVPSSQSDTTVYLNITSKDDKLPKGFDLKPYLSLTDGTNTYKMDDETGYVTISTISTDHKIKEDGSAVATLTISYKLPAGTYNIVLSLCGETVSVKYIKQASSACAITNMKFNGSTVTFDSNNKATSNILFGRAYNNIELIDIDGTYSEYYNFYLDNLEVSANATVTSTATKTLEEKTYYFDADNEITYNITSYEITYTVTAEDGTFAKYYHTLTEYDPYDKTNNPKYGDIYKDGTTDDVANTAFDETVTNGTKNQTVVSFERGNEAYYRLKYDFSKIYTLGNNVVYSKEETTDSSLAGVATFNLEYRGISADVNEYCDAGTYTFLYKYKNTQEWNIAIENGVVTVGETTYIQYTFPRLVINKTYSTDATLHSIILIDAYKEVGKASTVMDINNLRPTDSDLKTNESYYQTLITATNNNIEVGEPINYSHAGTDYSAYTYTDYYTVGTVSNALLTNYAPTFEIESHAMIFQSTTLAKLKTYGFDKNQTATDAAILGDHISNDGKILFIYVPFTYTSNGKTLTKNFLVKMNGKTLTEVYEDTYTGLNTETSVATLTNVTLDTIRTLKLDAEAIMPSFTAGGVTYTLSNIAGNQTNNSSLNMDYIGNPLDDHFWYVSYVVFSEDYIRSSSNTHIKFYHTALIDISNNVYFTIKVVTPNDATFTAINNIYVTVLGYTKNKTTNEFEEVVVGTYVNKKVVDTTANTITYELIYSIQILPSAYYYFYIDLPGGYIATSKITDPAKVFIPGTSSDYLENIANYEGAYLPPSSIVVQRVPVTITVSTGTSDNSSWAIATSDIYTRLATLTQD